MEKPITWTVDAETRIREAVTTEAELATHAMRADLPLPPFTNDRAICARCGNRRDIRVHFDRGCPFAEGDHYHRLCPCGHEWVEACS